MNSLTNMSCCKSSSEIMLFRVRMKEGNENDDFAKNSAAIAIDDTIKSARDANFTTSNSSSIESSAVNNGCEVSSSEIKLFGVNVKVDSTGKSKSKNASGSGRERKRGNPWTEEEQKLFLLGLEKVGKGDWKGISRNFVKTRTSTQVASHAQKYFVRQTNFKRRRQSSIFGITTDSVAHMLTAETKPQENLTPAVHQSSALFPTSTSESSQFNLFAKKPVENHTIARINEAGNPSYMFIQPVPILSFTHFSTPVILNTNPNNHTKPLNLSLSLSSNHN